MKDGYAVAVVGATGAVGEKMISVLAQRQFPVKVLRLFASERSAGKTVSFLDEKITVENLKTSSLEGINIALFSAGASVSRAFAARFTQAGAVVIDNSSAFRMDEETPLVVPEVNPNAARFHHGIIANPNCSTIQLVVAINLIHRRVGIKRLIVTALQSVSGTGREALVELLDQSKAILAGEKSEHTVYPHQIAFNLLPHIGSFLETGYTEEEMKLVNETRKILGDETIRVCATCVRVPVPVSHSEAVTIETRDALSPNEARDILMESPGVILVDEPTAATYPLPVYAAGKDEVFVGRVRRDISAPSSINMWVVSDNLRKGAALNAIQIAELLIKNNWL